MNSFYETLAEKIKSSLVGDRLKDPDCRIEVEGHQDIFQDLIQRCILTNGKFLPYTFSSLDCVLGRNWHKRIYNRLGDFAYVCEGRLKFCIRNRRPIISFEYHGGAYIETVTEKKPVIVATFVICSGNRTIYEKLQ